MMRFGCFGFIRHLDLIRAAGFDCAELDITEVAGLSETAFQKFRESAADSGLSLEVFSGLIPLTVRFHAPDFDETYWLDYVRNAAERLSLLGAKMVPFGAGKCRSIPEDCVDRRAAEGRVVHFVRECARIFADYGITLVVEPLGPANSNYIQTLPQANDFLEKVSEPNCMTMCDLRHMYKNEEPFSDITKYIPSILHAHIDYPRGELWLFPQKDDGYDYAPYFSSLHQSGYNRILTIEATSYQDFGKEAASSLVYLKELAANAGF